LGPLHKAIKLDELKQGIFCDGTRRYGVPAPFFQLKKKQLFVMYIVNE